MRGDVVCLMQRFGIGGGECPDLLDIRLAVRSGHARLEEGQHLVERPCKMHGRALHENVRAMVIAAEPEAEAAQHELVRHIGITAAHRETRQHARWFGEALGLGNFLGPIRRGIGAANASARGEARAPLWRITRCRFQRGDDGGRRGGAGREFGQAGTCV
jgi:hypothetical protein